MNATVCTLFEGHYHFGVAALTNSLYRHGFVGSIYAGYRGQLPKWASKAKPNESLRWKGGKTLQVAGNIELHFLPVTTNHHLANYKPDFMLKLWRGPAEKATSISYFDPDIVIKCRWTFFDAWMTYGIALVHEIVNNPMPYNHPIRLGWGKLAENANLRICNDLNNYFNSGFCGVSKENVEFIENWRKLIESAVTYFGFNPAQMGMSKDTPHTLGAAGDQDAMNLAAMCSKLPMSEVGPEGMDFKAGGSIMSHAAGTKKPWKKQFILSSFKGIRPSIADKEYWKYVNGPIENYSSIKRIVKRSSISVASLIGRLYSRK